MPSLAQNTGDDAALLKDRLADGADDFQKAVVQNRPVICRILFLNDHAALSLRHPPPSPQRLRCRAAGQEEGQIGADDGHWMAVVGNTFNTHEWIALHVSAQHILAHDQSGLRVFENP